MKSPPLRLRMALHAFPRRFRAARTAEILATFEEAELAGDADPYGMAALADVLVAGWAERLRTHPPAGPYLKYRLLDGRLDTRWHRWMLDDVRGRWYGLRRVVVAWLTFAVVMVVFHQAGMPPPDMVSIVGFAVGVIAISVFATPSHRRRTLRRHGYDPATLTWAPPQCRAATAPRPHRLVRVAPIAFTMAAALVAVAPFAVLASLGHIGAGGGNITRDADGQLPATIAAVAAATLVGAAGILGRRSVCRRFTRIIPDDTQGDLVFSDLASAGALSVAVFAVGLIVCFAPITPLIVPLAFVVVSGAAPALALAGIDARRRGPDGAVTVWTPRPYEVGTAVGR